ncbi:MAG: hypothetical protein KGM16_10975 [Bacteroidota bacterium]|nr:hypothetical protein [Bacteroidota bacterium]
MKKGVHDIRFVTVLIISILLSSQHSIAQLPKVKTTVDKTNILIGQRIHYKVETSMPDNTYQLSWFSIPDSFGNFVPIIKDKIDSSYSNGIWNFGQQITITSFDSGRQLIPSLALSVSTLDGDSTFNIYTDSIPINVTYSPADSTLPFHDIKNIIEVKKTFPWWIYLLIGISVILLIALIIFIIKKSKKKKDTGIFNSKLSPYNEAMQLLDELQKENLLEKNEFKEYHTRLSDIFKRYLSRKTNTYQMHLTTDELLIELNELDLSKEKVFDFANSLRMGNAVKFARYVPPDYENQKCFSETREMITNINNIQNKKPEDGI